MRIIILSATLFILCLFQAAQASVQITITGMSASPSAAVKGGDVLLTCKITHSGGLAEIDRVAALLSAGNINTSYARLYDDGSHGDAAAHDGIYSLTIKAPAQGDSAAITFMAVDKNHNEVQSEPIYLSIQ